MLGYPWQKSWGCLYSRVRVWKSYRTYPKYRVRVWMLVPISVSDPLYFKNAVLGTRVFSRGRTELTKVSGTGTDVVPNLSKCRVRVWISYRTYQRVRYRYRCCTKLTRGSGTGMDVLPSLSKESGMVRLLVPVLVPDFRYFNRAVPRTRVFPAGVLNLPKCRVRVWKSYQAYQSVGYGQYKG